MVELKSCPFCGGKAELIKTSGYSGNHYYYVRCFGCGIQTMQYSNKDVAADIWNKRYGAGDIRPCPFCGSEPNVVCVNDRGEHSFYVECENKNCLVHPASFSNISKETAIKIWNHRVEK